MIKGMNAPNLSRGIVNTVDFLNLLLTGYKAKTVVLRSRRPRDRSHQPPLKSTTEVDLIS